MIIALAEINSWKAGYLQINIITWSLSFSPIFPPPSVLGINQRKGRWVISNGYICVFWGVTEHGMSFYNQSRNKMIGGFVFLKNKMLFKNK